MSKQHFKLVALTAIGGALEFYDFTIYALFAPYIQKHFFAQTSSTIALINTFAVFALGYLARPLGGIFFGHLGDKYGRKSAFTLAILLMALATLFMGCLPSYQSIGVTAPLLLIILRFIQGFSVGGEIPGAIVFITEHMPNKYVGFAIGIIFMCITLGNMLGAGVGLALTSWFTADQMMSWGWRIPFIIGFFLGIISYYIRKSAHETPVFLKMMTEKQLHNSPFKGLIQSSKTQLFKAFLLTAATASVISLFLYLPTYLSSIINLDMSRSYFINILSFLSFALTTALFGLLSDHVNRKKLIILGSSLLIVLSYPLFWGLTAFSAAYVWVFVLGISLCAGMINGCYPIFISKSFPAHLRYSCVGLSYSLGVAVFGGIAPLAFTCLIQGLHMVEAPAFYLMACASLTLLATVSTQGHLKESRLGLSPT